MTTIIQSHKAPFWIASSLTFLAMTFLIFLSFPVTAQDKKVTLDVFPSVTAVEKGQSFDIAIRQNIIDGWHTYWVNAGDSGEPMTIIWDDIDGISYSSINEPTPKRIEYPPLVNFGHEGSPLFTQTILLDDEFEGNQLNLNGRAMWLVCQEICIPEEQNISLSIPINNNGIEINKQLFADAKSKMPLIVNWKTTFTRNNNEFDLNVIVPETQHNQMTDVEIYPYDWGLIKTTSSIMSDISDDGVTFTGHASDREFDDLTSPFIIKTAGKSYQVNATLSDGAKNNSNLSHNIFIILGFAFIGGLILNLMPCVFPVLSMKALSLVTLSDKERKHARESGLAYTAGIIVSFIAIAGVLIVLKGAGETIGWGFQLQSPYVVAGLATLLFVLGLNLMGLFEIGGRLSNVGSSLASGHSKRASFFTGVLATLVATPCTAPFMASAIGYALTQNAFISLMVFATLGFGLAFPYLLITFIPTLQKTLPKPGAWMNTFKQTLAWLMFASTVWLVWVLVQQAGDLAIIYILGLFTAITFIIWFFGKTNNKFLKISVSAVLVTVFTLYACILSPKTETNYEPFDVYKLEEILRNNPQQAVFTNMTAAWCITCLVNERTSLSDNDVMNAFTDNNVLYMKGDWTNRDEAITKYLESHGRNGVPLYVYYAPAKNGARGEPIILPQVLTPSIILNTLKGE